MTHRDRDLSVERWLRQTPAAGARSESAEDLDACLDAETLAAWAEGLLDGTERSSAEAHASNCARCQAMLAVMARTTPGPTPSVGSPIRKWLMMLGPAVAAAAAVALWFAVDQNQRAARSVVGRVSQDEAAAARAPESRPSAISPPAPLEKDAERDALKRESASAAPKELTDALRERESRVGADKSATAARVAVNKRSDANERSERKDVAAAKPADARLDSDRVRAAVPEPVATPPPPPPASLPAPVQSSAGNRTVQPSAPPPAAPQQVGQTQNQNQAPNQNQNQAPLRQQGVEERVIPATGATTTGATTKPAAAGGVARDGAFAELGDTALRFRANAGNFEVATPETSVRWRVITGRTVQRSSDAGATWTDQYTAESGVTLTAGAAPSSTVCWLVGRSGAIVLTTDGKAWQRVKFPEPVDFTAVSSPDARTATVTTADGRTFGTTDGGRNWTRR